MWEKKEISNDGYAPKTHTTTYTYGNTTVIVKAHFKEEGPTITELLEKVIMYEGIHGGDKTSNKKQDN